METYDFFISYSRANLDKVKEIVKVIETHTGATCWMDLDGIESGEQFESVIVSAIKRCQSFLFFRSEQSMNSDWALRELRFAKNSVSR